MPTYVIFRKWPDGTIDALFPLEEYNDKFCMCYSHIGQHSGADYTSCIKRTKPATNKEFAPLLRELIDIGYHDLLIVRRKPRNK